MLIQIFIGFAVIMLVADIGRVISDSGKDYTTRYIFWHILPAMEALVIVSALVVALWKLRSFNAKYGLDVDITKLKVHFAICMELMLIFIIRFFRSMIVDKVSTGSEGEPIEDLASQLNECLYW